MGHILFSFPVDDMDGLLRLAKLSGPNGTQYPISAFILSSLETNHFPHFLINGLTSQILNPSHQRELQFQYVIKEIF